MKKHLNAQSCIIFFIISLLYFIGNFIWWKLNTPIIPMNISAVHFGDIFRDGYLYFNAPITTWIMKGVFFVLGKDYFDLKIICVNYIFFLISLYFIYKIGVELKDKATGNVAMILFALTPAVYGLSRQYGHQDWHVMIAITVNIYCLIKLNYFKNRKWSVLYGISVGLGLLVKDSFLAYFFMPWFYVVIKSLIEKIDIKKILNILMTIAIGSLIAGCHYFRFEIIEKILNEPFIEASSQSIFSYMFTIGLSEYLLSPPIFILFIISFIWILLKYKNKNKWIILLWFIIPWGIIILMPHRKEPEYGMGFIPAIILIISVCLNNIKESFLKKAILILIIIVCLFQYSAFSYNLNKSLFNLSVKQFFYFSIYNDDYEENFMIYKKDMGNVSLADYIKDNFSRNSVFLYMFSPISEMIEAYLKVKDCFKVHTDIIVECNGDDIEQIVFDADVIIDIEAYSILNIEYTFYKEKILLDNFNKKIDFIELKELLSKFIKKVKNDYIKIDEFYLDWNNKIPENHVYVFGKKELFEKKEDIIKYEYKLQKK